MDSNLCAFEFIIFLLTSLWATCAIAAQAHAANSARIAFISGDLLQNCGLTDPCFYSDESRRRRGRNSVPTHRIKLRFVDSKEHRTPLILKQLKYFKFFSFFYSIMESSNGENGAKDDQQATQY